MSELPVLVSLLALCADPVGVAVNEATIVLVNEAVATLTGLPPGEDNIALYMGSQNRARLTRLCRLITDPDVGFEGPLATRIVVQVNDKKPVELWVLAASTLLYESDEGTPPASATLLRFRTTGNLPAAHESPATSPISLEALRPTEAEILQRTLNGDRVQTIADQMFLSEHTVRNSLKRINRKLGARSTAELRERLAAGVQEFPTGSSTMTLVRSNESIREVRQVS